MATETTVAKCSENAVSRRERGRCGCFYQPNVDIVEKADELVVTADVPGVPAGNIDVNFENGTLTIHGRVEARPGMRGDYLRREFGVGDFTRTFQVSEAVDASRISAECANGVLTLHLPKVEAVKPRKIEVQAS